MKRLIVNADDFGLCAGVDRGIARAVAAGVVTSVSLFAERATPDSVRRLTDHGAGVGLGLHLDLTRDLLTFDPNDLEARVRAQWDRFVTLVGRPPDHVDTHKQIHRQHFPVLRAVAALGVPVRAPDRRTRLRLRRWQVPCTDAFVGGVGRRAYWQPRRLAAVLRNLGDGITELMCHPGEVEGMPAQLHYASQRLGELRTFLALDLRDRIRAQSIELVSYGVLGK